MKMRGLLGNTEYERFEASYDDKVYQGLRVNTLKISVEDFINKSPFTLSPPFDYESAGFRVLNDSQPGLHPYHAAGLYYLQEPSAMVVASLMRPQPGEFILDLAAAPGGKSTHLASLMGDIGLLVANDTHRGRVSHLVQNMEQWGVTNTVITNNTPGQLATAFGPFFDRVLVDAPCSGEGMFRRKGGFEWSQEIVVACSRRQTNILDMAAKLVRPGGVLTYSTCTFSPEENEEVIGRFLNNHTEFEMAALNHYAGFACGHPSWLKDTSAPQASSLSQTVRLWPHHFSGEGHFIALMVRKGNKKIGNSPKSVGQSNVHGNLEIWFEFARDHLRFDYPDDQLKLINGYLYLTTDNLLPQASLRIVRHGLLLGEIRKGYFKPAHALALAIRPSQVAEYVNFSASSPEIQAYLSGQSLASPGQDGWVLICIDGFSLGWGKRVSGQIKNHYPRGLRRPVGTKW